MPDTDQARDGATGKALEDALAALTALHPKKIDLGLDRVERVLAALDNPQHKFPPTIHVAGTNGKGSTIAYLRAIAEAAGLRAHVYTSPHLVHFRERIVLGSKEIDDETLIDVLSRVQAANDGQPLSFFEATTAAAFLVFSEHPADICLIEVGLGGRFDATNVIDPVCCGITPIDYDHAEFLGRELTGIAREKAGIMQGHVPVFIGTQSEIVNAVLDAEAGKLRAPVQFSGQDFRAFRQHGRLVFESEKELLDLPLPALPGDHQIQNAGLAIAIARHMQFDTRAIETGLTNVSWPARLQNLTEGALAEPVLAIGGELWLDGGHNPHAARAVANTMADLEARSPRPLILITGILANKDIGGFLDAYAGMASAIIGVTIPGHTALAPETLSEMAGNRGILSEVAADLPEAIAKAIAIGETVGTADDEPARILICGSLYLAGEVLKANQ